MCHISMMYRWNIGTLFTVPSLLDVLFYQIVDDASSEVILILRYHMSKRI